MTTYTSNPVYDGSWQKFWPWGAPRGNPHITDWTVEIVSERNLDAKLPNWRKIIKLGGCATTTASGTLKRVAYAPAFFFAESESGDTWLGTQAGDDNQTFLDPVIEAAVKQQIEDTAKLRYIRRAKGVIQPFEGGVFLGEIRETLRIIRNPAAALRKNVQKHGAKMKAKKSSLGKPGSASFKDAVAGSWLEASFGWSPLVSEIDSGMAALAQYDEPVKRLIPIGATEKKRISSITAVYTPSIGPVHFKLPIREDTEYGVRFRGRVKWDPSQSKSFNYFGLGLDNVAPTAWELIPYSFVADYFTNIGDIIEAWSFGTGNIAWTDRTRFTKMKRWYDGPSFVGYSYHEPIVHHELSYPKLNMTYKGWERAQFFESLVPDFHWDIPGAGSRKWLNLAALAAVKI